MRDQKCHSQGLIRGPISGRLLYTRLQLDVELLLFFRCIYSERRLETCGLRNGAKKRKISSLVELT
jgi:hypothetical protein